MLKKSFVKVVFYLEILFEHSSDFRKLEIEYPNLAYEFNWLLKLRCGYRFNSIIVKATKFVNYSFPDTCPCCNSGNLSFEYFLF